MTSPAQFDFRSRQQDDGNGEDNEAEDQMDWIGGRISKLIEEGKKALGAEVIVMSDSKEDEVDDESEAWEEVDQDLNVGRSLRHNKAKTVPPLGHPPSYSTQHGPSSLPSPAVPVPPLKPNIASSSLSFHSPLDEPESPNFVSATWKETESDWQSSEIRASMEKARAKYPSNNRR